jgi:hypothetical protein
VQSGRQGVQLHKPSTHFFNVGELAGCRQFQNLPAVLVLLSLALVLVENYPVVALPVLKLFKVYFSVVLPFEHCYLLQQTSQVTSLLARLVNFVDLETALEAS